MTATSPAESAPPALSLSSLLRCSVAGTGGQRLGKLADVIVRLRGQEYPLVTGLVADIGGLRIFIDAECSTDWHTGQVRLTTPKLDLRQFERRAGEVLLSTDILGHRLIDIPRARLVRAYDLHLARADGRWVLSGVRTRPVGWWQRLARSLRGGAEPASAVRDWKAFEALIGHQPSIPARTSISRLRRMKPPQIADLLEEASRAEQTDLLMQVHADPDLEADVFEELDDDEQSRLLRDRSDTDVAAILARMDPDDAADALGELPQQRRQPVLELLPAAHRVKVTTLLGYNPTTAGGLMSVDYLVVPPEATAEDALDRIRTAGPVAPEALTTVYSVDEHGLLRGAANVITLLQSDPTVTLETLGETDPVRVAPDADLVTVALLMTDYNLLNLPVVDERGRILGVITVDDALDAAVPGNWRQREPESQA